jgi:enoyl-CoA hydratase
MSFKTISVEQTGRVVTVRLGTRPRNFLGYEMAAELLALVKRLERDRSVGAVVLTGSTPGSFLTHADTRDLLAQAKAAEALPLPTPSNRQARGTLALVQLLRRLGAGRLVHRTPMAGVAILLEWDELFLRMNESEKAYIAAIDGLALGAGVILALGCDVRLIADTESPLGLIESTIGFMAAAGGTQRLVRAVGAARAVELLLEGRTLTPAEAREIGLVHRVVSKDQLLEEAQRTAARLARRSPLAIREIKRLVYDAGSKPLREGIRIEEASMMMTLASPQAIRALEAYHERLATPLEETTEPQLLEAWHELHEGALVDTHS